MNRAVTKTYAYGLQRISENQLVGGTWTPSFYGYDGHGNVRYLTNAAGAITDTYTYDAFGLPITTTGTTPNAYTYSGERFDQNIGLFHLRARDYNPLTGRFETMDPAAGDILSPATLHKYVYAGNNPVNASDPTGREAIEYNVTLIAGGSALGPIEVFAVTAAENALLVTGVSDAIAGIRLAAEAGSYEEAIDILTYTAEAILKSRPLVRAFLCAPVGLAYDLAEDQLDDYARAHQWSFLKIEAMDNALDKGKETLVGVCTGWIAVGGK